jgi:tricorn protease
VPLLVALAAPALHAASDETVGYYRLPALYRETLVFVAEGDLWRVSSSGGRATRLTSHPADESSPAISPDGLLLAFSAAYEGPTEVYAMPLRGGLPVRLTWDASPAIVVGWTPAGEVLYTSQVRSTLPADQLYAVAPTGGAAREVPLAQAADGAYDETGNLYFTRLPFQGSHTKRYRGGTAQQLWALRKDAAEATPLTADYPGTSKEPMVWQGRLYFASDRDGSMNLWSIKPDGSDRRQHTRHSGWDVAAPSLSNGRIAYQLGADLHLLDLATDTDKAIPISLDSDLDQTREHWIKQPLTYLTSAHISPTGDRVALTARGRVFVAPARQGRLVEVTRREGVRYRDGRFFPDGKSLVTLSDESGEVELWRFPANGVGADDQLTREGDVLRWDAVPSPDGRYVAHRDKNQRLWLYDVETKSNSRIDESEVADFADLAWSPDSRWLAYVYQAPNLYSRVRLYGIERGERLDATSDRYDSASPVFSRDGKWLYFLSERNLESVVGGPWGSLQPEPFFDRRVKLYALALEKEARSPFAPVDELHPPEEPKKPDVAKEEEKKKKKTKEPQAHVQLDRDGLAERLYELPIGPGNYSNLMVTDEALLWVSTDSGTQPKRHLVGATIARENVEVKTLVADVRLVELSLDAKKMLVRKGDALYVIDPAVTPTPADLEKKAVDLSGWALSVVPREEWRQMFDEAWRLERDYFYDPGMHGVDWPAIRTKYRPLVDRVRSRGELADLLAQMVSELSALHIFVFGGDQRGGQDDVQLASLGATLVRDERGGGYRVDHVYRSDPDEPNRASPLARPDVRVVEGDRIESIDGVRLLESGDPATVLRGKVGKQVLLRVRPGQGGPARDVIVVPLSEDADKDLRYHEWEYTRRLETERASENRIGYVHLRAMTGRDIADWTRGYYPAFDRQGLIIDVRSNRGGNIDSWILGRLVRKAWSHWNQRVGRSPTWNMQYAFRGHIAVLCNEYTASDGEAFTEGFKRLGLGKVFGTRTWGGEIWLTASNFLVDGGIATAAEFGVYGPEGQWLIEGHGVDPDVVVDNLPRASYDGKDAQLEAAIRWLEERIKEEPRPVPDYPPYKR